MQNLKLEVDGGPFLDIDGRTSLGGKIFGDKVLIYALTDWKSGWAVFEGNLNDFNIDVARRVMTEAAAIDKHTLTRFIARKDGTVDDIETKLNWAQSDNGNDIVVAYANDHCKKKGATWAIPSSVQLKSLFLETGSIRTKCGGVHCYVSPTFKLSSMYVWSHDFDDSGRPLMMNLVSGVLEPIRQPYPTTATALCVRLN